MLGDNGLNFRPHPLRHFFNIKHKDLIFADLKEVFHGVPTIVLIAKQCQHCFKHVSDCLGRVHEGSNLLDIL